MAQQPAQPPGHAPGKHRKAWLAVVAVLAIGAMAYAIGLDQHHPRTNDAFAQADAIGVASQVAGRIVVLEAKNNAAVRKGDILFTIDPRPYQYESDRLHAQLATLDHQIELTQRQVNAQKYAALASAATVTRAEQNASQRASTFNRLEPLLTGEFVTREQVDQARTARDTADSELKAAMLEHKRAVSAVSGVDALVAQKKELQAAIAHADYQLEQTVVRAPFDGLVVNLDIAEGEFASVGRSLFTLIDTRTWYVVANFRETELPRIRPGTTVRVYLMIDPERKFEGVVESVGWGVLPDEGGSAEGLPKVPKSINWVHVAQRFPVRIRVKAPAPDLFRIGASAVAVVASSSGDGR